jgi:hypothetical protein
LDSSRWPLLRLYRERKRKELKTGINRVKLEEMRTRFGGIEEILGGREGSIGRSNRRATLELIIAVRKAKKPLGIGNPFLHEKEEIRNKRK